MYIISDVVEMGNADELILAFIKEWPTIDDPEQCTVTPEETFDE